MEMSDLSNDKLVSYMISYFLWTYIPDTATNYVQKFFYAFWIRAGDPKPVPGSARFDRDRRRILISMLVLYLVYTIYEAHWNIRRAGDLYATLGLPHDADTRTIQSRSRKMNRLYHPDKLGAGVSNEIRIQTDLLYKEIVHARDVLQDPIKRFAYDRFGPESATWQSCYTLRDYVTMGYRHQAAEYVALFLMQVVSEYLGWVKFGNFWRSVSLLSLIILDIYARTTPEAPRLSTLFGPLRSYIPESVTSSYVVRMLTSFMPNYLPFQALNVLNTLFVAISIATGRIGGMLGMNDIPSGDGSTLTPKQSEQQLQNLERTIAFNDLAATRILARETEPFYSKASNNTDGVQVNGKTKEEPVMIPASNDSQTVQEVKEGLRERIRDRMVVKSLRRDKEVTNAVNKVRERRNAGGKVEVVDTEWDE